MPLHCEQHPVFTEQCIQCEKWTVYNMHLITNWGTIQPLTTIMRINIKNGDDGSVRVDKEKLELANKRISLISEATEILVRRGGLVIVDDKRVPFTDEFKMKYEKYIALFGGFDKCTTSHSIKMNDQIIPYYEMCDAILATVNADRTFNELRNKYADNFPNDAIRDLLFPPRYSTEMTTEEEQEEY